VDGHDGVEYSDIKDDQIKYWVWQRIPDNETWQ